MTYYEIVRKLVGEINPCGDTITDKDRLENLKSMTDLIDKLLMDVNDVLFFNKESLSKSKKTAADHVCKFLDRIGVIE